MDKDTMAKLIERGAVLKRLQEKKVTQKLAALELKVSERHIRRMNKRYLHEGAVSLIHKNRGRPSPRKLSEEIELEAIEWLRQRGPDFGSTFAQEKLEEYLGIKVSVGTIRKWRIKHNLHVPRSSVKTEFERRQRKPLFGLMVQIDGSPDDWFEGRRAKCMLLTAIDDATGKIVARFAEQEETKELMILMRMYIEKYGRPHMAYTDHGGPYKVNVGNPEGDKMTQLGRAFDQLGIELVHANSPQAKGRVERNHGTNQDRLEKEMRLRGISTIEAGNKFLEEVYIPDFNKRFVVEPAGTQDAHRPLNGIDLDNIFCIKEKRVVQNDGIVQFEKRIFQLTKNRIYAQPKSSIFVHQHLDGAITLWAKNVQLGYEELHAKPVKKYDRAIDKTDRKHQAPGRANKNWSNGIYTPHRLKHKYENAITK